MVSFPSGRELCLKLLVAGSIPIKRNYLLLGLSLNSAVPIRKKRTNNGRVLPVSCTSQARSPSIPNQSPCKSIPTMSWFPKSLVNTFLPEPDQEQEHEQEQSVEQEGNDEIVTENHGRGVKEDLTELTKTITRQLWGVATFLAPLPEKNPTPVSEESADDSQKLVGIRNDFAEIGGSFKSGLSRFTTHKAVDEISRLASSFLHFQGGDEVEESEELEENCDDGSVVFGITEEILEFVREISMHPETWLDFLLLVDHKNFNNFEMSDAQQAHASAVERLVPGLAALRVELCLSHMSKACFWKIYFVLLNPWLKKSDFEVLCTPQIVEARGLILQVLQKRERMLAKSSVTAPSATEAGNMRSSIHEENTQAVQEKEDLTDYVSATNLPCSNTPQNVVDQPLQENCEMGSPCNAGRRQFENEEVVSFSDFEEDVDDGSSGKMSLRPLLDSQHSRVRNSEGEESGCDWVDVDEFDFDSASSL